VLRSDRRFEFRWPWLPDSAWETTMAITLEPAGYGTLMTLTDGPFAWLRGYADFSVELRGRRY
jgi:hypothetical protein